MARLIKKTSYEYILQNAAMAMGYMTSQEVEQAFTQSPETIEESMISAMRQAISELKPTTFIKTLAVDKLTSVTDSEGILSSDDALYELPDDFVEVYKVYIQDDINEPVLSFELVNGNIKIDNNATIFQYFYAPDDKDGLNAIKNPDALFLRVVAFYTAMILLPVVNPMMRDEVYVALQQVKGDYSSRNKKLAKGVHKTPFRVWIDNKNIQHSNYYGFGGRRIGRFGLHGDY